MDDLIKPKKELSDYVYGYDVFELNENYACHHIPLPLGYPEIFFHFGPPMVNDYADKNYRFFIGFESKLVKDVKLEFSGKLNYISTLVFPHIFASVLHNNYELFENRIIHLERYLSRDIDSIVEHLNTPISKLEKIRFFENILEEAINKLNPKTDALFKEIFQYISESDNCSIDNLTNDLGVSKKTIDRRFKQIDITAKDYLRIIRFNKAFRLLHKNPAINLFDILAICNFHDKSHFVKEFKFFTGKTATEIFKNKEYLLLNRLYVRA